MIEVATVGEELAFQRLKRLTYGALPDSPALALIRDRKVKYPMTLEPVIDERSPSRSR